MKTLTFNATAGVKMMLTNVLALTAQYSYTNGSYSVDIILLRAEVTGMCFPSE